MTKVRILGSQFLVNDIPANRGRTYQGFTLDGLLMNSRMINGAFDDANPETVSQWAYPDTGVWDANRNTDEFIQNMLQWKKDGLDAFTLGIQGGSPQGYSTSQPWDNAGFTADGELLEAYKHRISKIINRADELGMVVILCYFYHGQDHRFSNEASIRHAVESATQWVLDQGWQNVLIEIANEVNWYTHYVHEQLKHPRIHELIELAKSISKDGRRLLVSTSFTAAEPWCTPEVLSTADFLLVHGNGTPKPERLEEMVNWLRSQPEYCGQPIMFNEDDNFAFDQPEHNMKSALRAGASWGFFDPGSTTVFPPKPTIGDYRNGYQAVPINWGVSSQNKADFFRALKSIS